jgi:hypothetical protein
VSEHEIYREESHGWLLDTNVHGCDLDRRTRREGEERQDAERRRRPVTPENGEREPAKCEDQAEDLIARKRRRRDQDR